MTDITSFQFFAEDTYWPPLFQGTITVDKIMESAKTPLHGKMQICADALLAWATASSGKSEIPKNFNVTMAHVYEVLGISDVNELYELSGVLMNVFEIQENSNTTT